MRENLNYFFENNGDYSQLWVLFKLITELRRQQVPREKFQIWCPKHFEGGLRFLFSKNQHAFQLDEMIAFKYQLPLEEDLIGEKSLINYHVIPDDRPNSIPLDCMGRTLWKWGNFRETNVSVLHEKNLFAELGPVIDGKREFGFLSDEGVHEFYPTPDRVRLEQPVQRQENRKAYVFALPDTRPWANHLHPIEKQIFELIPEIYEQHPDAEIVYKYHPVATDPRRYLKGTNVFRDGEFWETCRALVCWNSNIAYEAYRLGIPVLNLRRGFYDCISYEPAELYIWLQAPLAIEFQDQVKNELLPLEDIFVPK